MSIADTMSQIMAWLASSWILQIWGTVHDWVLGLIVLGNGFFRAAINLCTGLILVPPSETLPEAWAKMREIATSGAFMGIASDLVVVGFMVSLIEYSITVRSHFDVEDFLKMLGRMCLANILVHHFLDLIEGLWEVGALLVNVLMPSVSDELLTDYAVTLPSFNLVWVIIGIVYAVVMIIISFKIVTAFYERFLWAFLAIPFGGPAFATIVGYGHFNQTAKAYIKYIIATILEFVVFALLIVLLGYVGGGFRQLLNDWVVAGLGEDNLLASIALGYLGNICFASLIAGMITKIDGQVCKMLAL